MIVNAVLHALICGFLVKYVLVTFSGFNRLAPLLVTTLLFTVPFSWFSILVAFQTQFNFMLLFSVLALHFLSNASYRVGYSFTALSMLSMTPGAFVLPAFIGVVIIDAIRSKTITRLQLLHATGSGLVFLLFVLYLPVEPASEAYYAQSVQAFAITVAAAISWPFRVSSVIGLVMYVPLVVCIFKSTVSTKAPRYLVDLGFFMGLQFLSMAMFRGQDGVPPPSRYWELMIIGVWLNSICALFLARIGNSLIIKYLAGLWIAIAFIGMLSLGIELFNSGLPDKKAESLISVRLVTEYLSTGNKEVFEGHSALEVSHPDTDALLHLLDDPTVRKVLPSALIAENPDRLKHIKSALLSTAPIVFLLGLCLLFYSSRRVMKP